ncbi:MAG TPA: hypothetical protein VHC22_32530 [Pirellulales bacterium]|nr:hypothetical protein [Pirellulales bacterium]
MAAIQAHAGVELTHLRTAKSKTWDLGNGVRHAVHSVAHLHWPHPQTGEWLEIDPTLDANGSPKSTVFDLEIHDIGYTFEHKHGGRCKVTLVKAGDQTAFDTSRRSVEGNAIVWRDVLPGLDVSLVMRPAGVEFVETLKDSRAPTTFVLRHEDERHPNVSVDTEGHGRDAERSETEISSTVTPISENAYDATVTFTGRVKRRDPTTRRKSWSTPVYPVRIDPTVSASITADADDGYEAMSPSPVWVSVNSADLLGNDGGKSYACNPGWRFALSVPQGATVSSATLTLDAISHNTGSTQTSNIWGTAADSSAAWSSSNRPSQQTKTTHSTALSLASASGSQTINVTAIVQEIVNRAGWSSGNHISLFGLPTNVAGSTEFADYHSYHGTPSDLATLSVTYTISGGGPSSAGPDYFGAVAQDNSWGGPINWSSPANAEGAPDGSYASFAFSGSSNFPYLLDFTGWQGSIPADAMPVGMTFTFYGHWSFGSPQSIEIDAIIIIGGTTGTGGSGVLIAQNLTVSNTDQWFASWGATNDNFASWGLGGSGRPIPTAAQVNAGDFGVALFIDAATTSAGTFYVDSAEMTVYYYRMGSFNDMMSNDIALRSRSRPRQIVLTEFESRPLSESPESPHVDAFEPMHQGPLPRREPLRAVWNVPFFVTDADSLTFPEAPHAAGFEPMHQAPLPRSQPERPVWRWPLESPNDPNGLLDTESPHSDAFGATVPSRQVLFRPRLYQPDMGRLDPGAAALPNQPSSVDLPSMGLPPQRHHVPVPPPTESFVDLTSATPINPALYAFGLGMWVPVGAAFHKPTLRAFGFPSGGADLSSTSPAPEGMGEPLRSARRLPPLAPESEIDRLLFQDARIVAGWSTPMALPPRLPSRRHQNVPNRGELAGETIDLVQTMPNDWQSGMPSVLPANKVASPPPPMEVLRYDLGQVVVPVGWQPALSQPRGVHPLPPLDDSPAAISLTDVSSRSEAWTRTMEPPPVARAERHAAVEETMHGVEFSPTGPSETGYDTSLDWLTAMQRPLRTVPTRPVPHDDDAGAGVTFGLFPAVYVQPLAGPPPIMKGDLEAPLQTLSGGFFHQDDAATIGAELTESAMGLPPLRARTNPPSMESYVYDQPSLVVLSWATPMALPPKALGRQIPLGVESLVLNLGSIVTPIGWEGEIFQPARIARPNPAADGSLLSFTDLATQNTVYLQPMFVPRPAPLRASPDRAMHAPEMLVPPPPAPYSLDDWDGPMAIPADRLRQPPRQQPIDVSPAFELSAIAIAAPWQSMASPPVVEKHGLSPVLLPTAGQPPIDDNLAGWFDPGLATPPPRRRARMPSPLVDLPDDQRGFLPPSVPPGMDASAAMLRRPGRVDLLVGQIVVDPQFFGSVPAPSGYEGRWVVPSRQHTMAAVLIPIEHASTTGWLADGNPPPFTGSGSLFVVAGGVWSLAPSAGKVFGGGKGR